MGNFAPDLRVDENGFARWKDVRLVIHLEILASHQLFVRPQFIRLN
jgi:hypothetical protein